MYRRPDHRSRLIALSRAGIARAGMARGAIACAAMVAVALAAGCTPPPATPQSRADAARAAACRTRVDEIYDRQHRAEIYTDTSAQQSSTPFSGGYVSGITTRGLSDAFARDEQQSDCLRESGGGPVPQ